MQFRIGSPAWMMQQQNALASMEMERQRLWYDAHHDRLVRESQRDLNYIGNNVEEKPAPAAPEKSKKLLLLTMRK